MVSLYLSICLSVCLSQESPLWEAARSSTQRNGYLKEYVFFLPRWAGFVVYLSSVFQDEEYWCMLGSGEYHVIYGFKSLFELKLLWKEGLKTYAGIGGLRYIFSNIGVWFPRQKYREIQFALVLWLCCCIRLGKPLNISVEKNTANTNPKWLQIMWSIHPLSS